MELGRKLALMLVAAAFLCSGNLCIVASKVQSVVPYSSITVTFLIEVLKLTSMLAAIIVTNTSPNQLQLRTCCYYAVPALLNALESNLNYVVLRYLDAATVSVLWNLKILLTAVLFRYVLKQPLTELHKLAIALLILGVLTSQSDRFQQIGSNSEVNKTRRDAVVMCECICRVDVEAAVKLSILVAKHGKLLLSGGMFDAYSVWTVVVIVVNSIGGIFMACILKYLDNIACVYSHSMAMMLTTLLSMIFFSFSPSLEFACGLGVLVISMYLYHHPLAQPATLKEISPASDTSRESDENVVATTSSRQLPKLNKYTELPSDTREKLEGTRISIVET
ncbi:UDP-N-acetylglucosamine transporter [Phytophthora palmivora]|uniref:UDP-N-acetylglucosamine transporter n=1 Tax=Phytophthora palmivora TaxID=4796 RepID=A0A2P4YKV6_9STRA|nr:UDP-N-acetylglucosamine transporter [Phytophthora palmivora]